MEKTYKWMLRKGSKKEICPQCGHKRFVPFVLTVDGKTPAGSIYGRCDREQSCGYFRYPGKEVMEDCNEKPEPRPELPPALFTFSKDMSLNYDGNSLFDAFKYLIGRDALTEAFRRYYIGSSVNGACVFPQYDGTFMRTAKAIQYGKDGHRLKDRNGEQLPVMWYHKQKDAAQYMESHQLKQCLFGQHLLTEHPEAKVMVVEAEKTAVLMAATDERTDRIWLACGGSQMLKGAIDLQCLEGHDVTLIPDHGQFWNWKRTADAHGWKCYDITNAMEARKLPEGSDIWDIKEYDLKNIKNQ